jgi:hypothetical protein
LSNHINTTVFIAILLTISIAVWYYRRQNAQAALGGPISKPKTVWLFYVLFHYFFLTVWCYFAFGTDNRLLGILPVFIGLVYFRLLAQSVLMFWLKKWTPPMGISYNLLTFVMLFCAVFSKLIRLELTNLHPEEGLLIGLYVLLGMILLTDSYYAWSFYKLVGNLTKGHEAIWYASEEEAKFRRINQVTKWLNLFFLAYTAVLLVMICFGHFQFSIFNFQSPR